MTREQIYDKVNQCETLDELAFVIKGLADSEGMIQGRENKFNAVRMANYCVNYSSYPKNYLTREFGIRQQAMYILYYNGEL